MRQLTIALVLALLAGACTTLPEAGPSSTDIEAGTQGGEGPGRGYLLVDLDETVAGLLAGRPPASLSAGFGDRRPPAEPLIGVGDALALTASRSRRR